MAKIDYDTVEALAAAARLNGITLQRWNRKRMRVEIRNAHTVTVRKRIVFALIQHVLSNVFDGPLYGGVLIADDGKRMSSLGRAKLRDAGITVPDLAANSLARGYYAWERSCS